MASTSRSGRLVAACISVILLTPTAVVASTFSAEASPNRAPAAKAADSAPAASGFRFYKFPAATAELCTGIGVNVSTAPFYSTDDCGFALFTLSGGTTAPVVQLLAEGATTPFATPEVIADDVEGDWQVSLEPDETWPSGAVTMRVKSGSDVAGETTFGHNLLGATFDAASGPTDSGDDIPVTGTISQLDTTGTTRSETGVAAAFTLRTTTPTGDVLDSQPVTAASDGTFSATVPGAPRPGSRRAPRPASARRSA